MLTLTAMLTIVILCYTFNSKVNWHKRIMEVITSLTELPILASIAKTRICKFAKTFNIMEGNILLLKCPMAYQGS